MNFGKVLIVAGILLIVLGGFITLGGKLPPLGRLPGDIVYRSGNVTFYFPLTTMILISITLSFLLRLLR
ncbi:DUF2905 domain-containing protein [Proteinivorax tanatarense]|uniref:DUF2905 domain-containing protein n=1 Tax=Proteinivorax tanatarense TaxID=1260629 RepID=A0AAU7VNN6_9FIRM